MQHYQFHIGDYIKDTAHLTDAEDLAYRRLLDLYYTLEGPLPLDVKAVCRRARIASQEVAEQVLSEFFTQTSDGFHHSRCDQELERIYAKSEKARASAKCSVEVRRSNYTKRAERLFEAKAKGTHTPQEWTALKSACGDKCVKCGAEDQLTKDHIQPIYQGGSDGLDNLQPLCKPCNSSKGPENIDYRPSGWAAIVERTLSERLANVELPITHNPLPITQESTSLPDKPAKERKRASVLADDFHPSDSGMAYAADRRLNCEQELEGFRNWHSAKGTTFKDWQAAWRTWCDKAVEFGRSGNKLIGGVNGKNGSSRADRIADTMRELRGANRPDARVIDGHAERVG